MLTLGTGIGSALFRDGVLLPNTELGHLQVRGKDAERPRRRLDQGQQGPQLARLEQAPGGVRRRHRRAALARPRDHRRRHQQGRRPASSTSCPRACSACPRRCRTSAGIVGAAMLAAEAAQLTRAERLGRGRVDGAQWRRSAGASRSATPTATCRSSTTASSATSTRSRSSATRARSTGSAPSASTRRACSARSSTRDTGGQLLDPARRRGVHDEAALPAGHRRARDALLHRGRRRRDRRLHAARRRHLRDRAPHRGRARIACASASRCQPAFDYARAPHRLDGRRRSSRRSSPATRCASCARSSGRARGRRATRAVAELTLARGERASFVLSVGQARARLGRGTRSRRRSRDTVGFWRDWIGAEHATAGAGARSSTARRSRSSC